MNFKGSPILAGVMRLPVAYRAIWILALGHAVSILLSLGLIYPNFLRYLAFPVTDPYFPFVLRSPVIYVLIILGPALIGTYTIVRPSVGVLRLWSWTLLLSGAVGLVHQLTFGWAEVLVMFWSGAWAVWLAHVRTSLRWGPLLVLLLCSLLFAYPAVGKLTSGFWTGELYWEHHWRHGSSLVSNLSALTLGADSKGLLPIFGALSILVELLIALIWLAPSRTGLGLMTLGVLGILLAGGVGFVGVVGLMLTLALSGLYLSQALARQETPGADSGLSA